MSAKSSTTPLALLIGQQPFFAGLSVQQVQVLAGLAMFMKFEPGRIIFHEEVPANRFYLILEGRVELESETSEAGMIPIRTVGPGEDLGWSWLFGTHYFHFRARAAEPTTAIVFYGTRLRQQCGADHSLGYELTKRIAEVIANRLGALQKHLVECANARTHHVRNFACETQLPAQQIPS